MSERSIVELLQQGNITVLTALLDRLLYPHSMTANLEKRDRVLQLAISSHPRQPDLDFCVPDRQGLVAIVRRLLLVLDVQTVDSVNLSWQLLDLERPERSWQQVDRDRYCWSTEFSLFKPQTTPETGVSSLAATPVASLLATPVSYVIKPTTSSDRAIDTDGESAAPGHNYFGSQAVQFIAASVIMVGLFLGIHFAIDANKPAKKNPSSSAPTNEVIL
jgi:hypothetical protein